MQLVDSKERPQNGKMIRIIFHMSCITRNFQPDATRAIQPQKMDRGLKFRSLEEEGL